MRRLLVSAPLHLNDLPKAGVERAGSEPGSLAMETVCALDCSKRHRAQRTHSKGSGSQQDHEQGLAAGLRPKGQAGEQGSHVEGRTAYIPQEVTVHLWKMPRRWVCGGLVQVQQTL